MASLLELRKKAEALGLKDYGKYSKQELADLVAKAEQGPTVVEVATEEAPLEEKELVEAKEAAGEVNEISAETAKAEKIRKVKEKAAAAKEKMAKKEASIEEAAKEVASEGSEAELKKVAKEIREDVPDGEALAAEEAAKAEKKEKRKAAAKEKRRKKTKTIYKYTPKEKEKPTSLGDKSSLAYDELLVSDESPYQISKKIDTYYSVVDKVIVKYFDVEKQEVPVE